MRISLVFSDWRDKNGKSIYISSLGNALSMGVFHSGSTFQADIQLDEEDRLQLDTAIQLGLQPVFYVTPPDEDTNDKDDRV